MHCISASLLFWVYIIIQETLQAIKMKKKKYEIYENTTTASAFKSSSLTSIIGDENESEEDMDEDLADKYGYGSQCGLTINTGCTKDTNLTQMITDMTPYLYPFSIEYNILIVGIWILLWENIGRMERHDHIPSIEIGYEDEKSPGITSNLIIYVDCHSSNRGLFAGFLMLVATAISIILFFIFTSTDKDKGRGLVSQS